ncbi:hypothetical protein Hs30E_01170 [Lactococcus hodotermopsidis]|uniref:Abi family protein n=1 Tax=Pseudolactococcus hodotermopsidis TaxID=2709157 RepID=A0A6A0B9V3_9LACT|nr:Abi family protein [Lactococcus hodotermopsidis]GFH41566.1 hypothetical protein Hs30E_01170 [Lactococcus hodotermopsidis]
MAKKGKSTEGKSTNSLMKHIRDKHRTNIKGSSDKQSLLDMGYYHGYKASKFIKKVDNQLEIANFSEIRAIYEFDLELKSIFYELLIQVETHLKNQAINYLVADSNPSLDFIYENMLIDYKSHAPDTAKYRQYLNKRLALRESLDKTTAYNFSKSKSNIIRHFFHNNKPIPLWAIFEFITLGTFGHFISCLKKDCRIKLSQNLKIHHTGFNGNGRILEKIIFSFTPLRNAVMHNSMIYDCRFTNSDDSNQIKEYLKSVTGIKEIDFNYIVDYLILLVYLISKQNKNKSDLKKYVKLYEKATDKLHSHVSFSNFRLILGNDSEIKISTLNDYINKCKKVP